MAPKRLLQDLPPAVSSTEEEEVSEDDTAEEEENGVSEGVQDEEEDEDGHRKSAVIASLKASKSQSSSDSEDESGSETESESNRTQPSPSASDFTIKPIASKPMEDSEKPKSLAKRKLNPAPPTTVTAGKKRTSESNIEEKESKKNKLSNGHEDLKKVTGAQRLWSEEDEIAILKGMIDYQSKKGADPNAEMEAFHGFVKKFLHADVSKNQLMTKIRRLKKKFQTIAEKGENGEDPVFSKPLEHKFFELSKKIWGASVTNGVDDNAKNKRKLNQNEVKNSSAVASPNGEINAEPTMPCFNSSFLDSFLVPGKLLSQPESAANILKEALPLIGNSRAKELESKWRKLQEEECELYLKRVDLVRESAKLTFEAIKSSKF